MDVKKAWTSLKKINEIGKKLTPDSNYVLINGMILAYQNDFDKDDADNLLAHGVAVSFIGEKLLSDLGEINDIPILINGSDLYRNDKEYKFKDIFIEDDSVNIVFDKLVLDDVDKDEAFIEYASSKFDRDKVIEELNNNFANDIDIFEMYFEFMAKYKPKEISIEHISRYDAIAKSNSIIDKCNDVIEELSECKCLAEKKFSAEAVEKLLASTKPMEIKFEYDDIFRFRTMKSLFKTASKSSNVSLRLLNDENDYYVLIHVYNKDVKTVLIHRALNF